MNRKLSSLWSAFTLLELLVVIAIIAILAGLLLPALGRARDASRETACMSNMKNIGTSMAMYTNANDGFFPTCYNYINGEKSGYIGSATPATGGVAGYFHWTAALDNNLYKDTPTSGTYPRSVGQYVCPSHTPRGFAPSDFTATRIPNPPAGQVSQNLTVDDRQAPRVSYVPNEAIMPRKKFGSNHDLITPTYTTYSPTAVAETKSLCLVNVDEIEAPANTILLAEFSNDASCIYGSSSAGAQAYKSHRPANAVKVASYNSFKNRASTVFDGENYDLFKGKKLYKLTVDEATKAMADAALTPDGDGDKIHHISYVNPNAHKDDGSNYLFVDGHVAHYTIEKTLDPGNWMWGKKMYSCVDKPLIRDN